MKTPQKGKSLVLVAGLLVLVILVFAAGWLSIHMLDLSKGLDQAIGIGPAADPGGMAANVPELPVVRKKIPLQPDPDPPPSPPDVQPGQTEPLGDDANQQAQTPMPPPPKPEPALPLLPDPVPSKSEPTLPAKPGETPAGIDEKPGEASSPARFTLQIGAFRYEENAHERMLILKSLGYTPYVFQTLDPKGRPWFTVRIGRYTRFEQAAASLQAYEKTSIFPAVILPIDSLFPAGGSIPGPS